MSKLAAAIRTMRGLDTQEDFAKRVGVTRQTVMTWEAARATPSGEPARKLNRMGIPLRMLIDGHVREEGDDVHIAAEGAANTGRAA